MSGYVLTPAAFRDLDEINLYIANDNPAASDRVMDAIFAAFETLAVHPGIGHVRPDLTQRAVKFWTVEGRHMIVYRQTPAAIEIIRVLGAGRDVEAILRR